MHRTYVTAHSLPGKQTNHPINNGGYYKTGSVLDVLLRNEFAECKARRMPFK